MLLNIWVTVSRKSPGSPALLPLSSLSSWHRPVLLTSSFLPWSINNHHFTLSLIPLSLSLLAPHLHLLFPVCPLVSLCQVLLVCFNLKGTDIQEKQRSSICRFTSQNACTSQGCAKPKPGVWNNLALPHEQQQAAGTGSWAETVLWNAGILSGILNAAQMITPKLRVIYHLLPPFSWSLLTSKWIAFAVQFSQIQVRLSNPWNTPDEVFKDTTGKEMFPFSST